MYELLHYRDHNVMDGFLEACDFLSTFPISRLCKMRVSISSRRSADIVQKIHDAVIGCSFLKSIRI
jgi:hypothetical protein